MKETTIVLIIILFFITCLIILEARIKKLENIQKYATLELARLQHPISKQEIEFIKSVKRAETNRGPGTLKGVKR